MGASARPPPPALRPSALKTRRRRRRQNNTPTQHKLGSAIHEPTLCPSFEAFLAAALHGGRAGGAQRIEQVEPGWCADPAAADVAAATGAPALGGAGAGAGAGPCARPAVLLRDVAARAPGVSMAGGADPGDVTITYRCVDAAADVCVRV